MGRVSSLLWGFLSYCWLAPFVCSLDVSRSPWIRSVSAIVGAGHNYLRLRLTALKKDPEAGMNSETKVHKAWADHNRLWTKAMNQSCTGWKGGLWARKTKILIFMENLTTQKKLRAPWKCLLLITTDKSMSEAHKPEFSRTLVVSLH